MDARPVASTAPHARVAAPSRNTRMQSTFGRDRVPKVAFFDVDNTIIRSNVVKPYVYMRMNELSALDYLWFVPLMALRAVAFLAIDRFDRSLFNKIFYRLYKDRCSTSDAKVSHAAPCPPPPGLPQVRVPVPSTCPGRSSLS